MVLPVTTYFLFFVRVGTIFIYLFVENWPLYYKMKNTFKYYINIQLKVLAYSNIMTNN